jgi:NADPH:quinone reductase-like Zn-dependent oxidoreductase
VNERLPLARLAEAEAMMEARALFGKIVLEP